MSDVFRQFAKYLIITYSHLMHYRLHWFSARARVSKIIGPLSRVFRTRRCSSSTVHNLEKVSVY